MRNKKSTLLIITDGFPDVRNNKYKCQFVFEYVHLIKDNFKEIIVISPQAKIPKIFLNFSIIKKYKNDFGFINYTIDNIKVFYPKIKFFPLSLLSKKLKHWLTMHEIEKILINTNFDLIHSHFIFPASYTATSIKKKYNKPLVITSHEGNIKSFFKKNARNIKEIKETFEIADHIIAVSEINQKVILNNFPNVYDKISVINNFVDLDKFNLLDKFDARKKLNLKPNQQILLNVANLITAKKGQLDLVEIIGNLSKINPNIVLYLIGDGPDKKKIENEIKKQGLSNKIKLLGALKNEDTVLWYNASDIFVFPSYYESFGIVQIEALACGIPVIAYANYGSNEIISKEIGLIINIGDKKNLELKILDMLDGKIPENFSKFKAHKYVEKNFSDVVIKKKLLETYSRLSN